MNLAKEFRRCVIASPGCKLISIDYEGIEAVLVGYFIGDPQYIRLAKLGVHAYVTSHVIGKPVDLSLPDEEVRRQLKHIKETEPSYRKVKAAVHRTNYAGFSPYGLTKQHPELFPTISSAQKIMDIYARVAPKLPQWHKTLRELAERQHYIGDTAHRYRFKHYFWHVFSYKPINKESYERFKSQDGMVTKIGRRYFRLQPGGDWNKVLASPAQSTAAFVIFDVVLALSDLDSPSYIGDCWFGKTPLRAVIHDELLMEIPCEKISHVMERVTREMTRPIKELPCLPEWGLGEYLTIGADAKIGDNWGEMEKLEL